MMLTCLRHLTALAVFAVLATFGAHAFGANCIGVAIPDAAKADGADLALNGSGIRKATILNVKVYVASLYLPQKSSDAAHLLATPQPWQLVLNFVHDVDAGDMRDAFDKDSRRRPEASSPRSRRVSRPSMTVSSTSIRGTTWHLPTILRRR